MMVGMVDLTVNQSCSHSYSSSMARALLYCIYYMRDTRVKACRYYTIYYKCHKNRASVVGVSLQNTRGPLTSEVMVRMVDLAVNWNCSHSYSKIAHHLLYCIYYMRDTRVKACHYYTN